MWFRISFNFLRTRFVIELNINDFIAESTVNNELKLHKHCVLDWGNKHLMFSMIHNSICGMNVKQLSLICTKRNSDIVLRFTHMHINVLVNTAHHTIMAKQMLQSMLPHIVAHQTDRADCGFLDAAVCFPLITRNIKLTFRKQVDGLTKTTVDEYRLKLWRESGLEKKREKNRIIHWSLTRVCRRR